MTRLRKKAGSTSSGKQGSLSDALVTVVDPTAPASEAYRMMRTNLFYASVDDPPKVVVLTSAGPGEGKSTTAANLGVTLSEAGKNTLLIDCDLRKPMLHSYFETRNMTGLVDILTMKRRPQDVWHEPMLKLRLITAGPPPLNPAELLSSRRFAEFLKQVRGQFDYVLVDTPPVTIVTDSAVVGALADGVLLVLDAQGTRKNSLRRAIHDLEGVGARVLGTVLNNVAVSRSEYATYGYTRAGG
jgi:capsular exopolysaccharide synthesis family protein